MPKKPDDYVRCPHCDDYLDADGGHCMYTHQPPAKKPAPLPAPEQEWQSIY